MKKYERWFHGLVGGFIGGGATAATSFFAMSGAHSLGVADVSAPNWHTLEVLFLTGGLTSAFAYLKQSPLPADDAVTITETRTTVIPTSKPTETTNENPQKPNP